MPPSIQLKTTQRHTTLTKMSTNTKNTNRNRDNKDHHNIYPPSHLRRRTTTTKTNREKSNKQRQNKPPPRRPKEPHQIRHPIYTMQPSPRQQRKFSQLRPRTPPPNQRLRSPKQPSHPSQDTYTRTRVVMWWGRPGMGERSISSVDGSFRFPGINAYSGLAGVILGSSRAVRSVRIINNYGNGLGNVDHLLGNVGTRSTVRQVRNAAYNPHPADYPSRVTGGLGGTLTRLWSTIFREPGYVFYTIQPFLLVFSNPVKLCFY